jgi:hypothetical protein
VLIINISYINVFVGELLSPLPYAEYLTLRGGGGGGGGGEEEEEEEDGGPTCTKYVKSKRKVKLLLCLSITP